MQLLYKSPSSTTEDFDMSRSDYFKLFETLRTRKDLALYVRKLNMDENVIGLEEVLENCSELLELELCYELVQAMRLYTEEGTMINNLKKLKSLKINGRWCNFTTVFRFIRAIAGRDLSELQAPGIRGNDDIPSTPSAFASI